jgi:NAD(P)-dependent dehydrogenase (short-subunit alcohol dehydrogenase family)
MDLQEQVALISGGLGDIGQAIARELASHGAAVAIGDLRPADQAQALVDELGPRVHYDHVDVSDDKAVSQWVDAVEKNLGLPTLIIPNAAISTLADLRTVTPAEWRKQFAINLDGAFYVALFAARRLVEKKQPGRIIFIGSWAADHPHRHVPTYCVTKAGLRMLMKQMALEYAAEGILVNEVAPGYVDAGLSGKEFAKDPEVKKRATQRVPIRQLTTPAEVAFAVAHLCDPRNHQMTGSTLLMDGGLSLR